MPEDPSAVLTEYLGQVVILDTQGPLIYIGTLAEIRTGAFTGGGVAVLTDADVHDTNDSRTSKDLYLVETRDLGVRVNRSRVLITLGQIASISLLSDVQS